ncbi:MAG: DnaJ domain-containing protein [Aetokthonos hydrillicola CCALA 1050]|jgi:curved DNA-binding protein CbpA|nr:DnaJ domain-containing protein [Aetokthonos hydrillicola CCALA 1050]MBW4587081.1 DnaJ domain-containing protein [Aetokthonos hydrillicola CCALA 1050]
MRDDSFDINDAYSLLGLKPSASQADVKLAYRELVKIWHPDRFLHSQEKQEAEKKLKQINQAYNRLKSYYLSPANSFGQINATKINTTLSNAEIFYHWGVENAKLERYEEAIANFTQAIRLDPYYVEAYKYRGFICSQLGYEYRATSDLSKAGQIEGKINKEASRASTSSGWKSKRKSLITKFFQWIKRLLRFKW